MNLIKRTIVVIVLMFGLSSCFSDEVQYSYWSLILPVGNFSGSIPEKLVYGEEAEIKMKYVKPSECYSYEGVYIEASSELHTITNAAQARYTQNPNCVAASTDSIEISYKFTVRMKDSIRFKFYTGKDSYGNNTFKEIKKVVENPPSE